MPPTDSEHDVYRKKIALVLQIVMTCPHKPSSPSHRPDLRVQGRKAAKGNFKKKLKKRENKQECQSNNIFCSSGSEKWRELNVVQSSETRKEALQCTFPVTEHLSP